jgi:hypothetical protein
MYKVPGHARINKMFAFNAAHAVAGANVPAASLNVRFFSGVGGVR